MNQITENLHYISDDSKENQRFIVDIVCKHPDVWQLSKITRRSPFGTCKLGLYKTEFNEHTDLIDFENKEMYADYYSSEVEPTEQPTPVEEGTINEVSCYLHTANNSIKIGGSYKTITLKYLINGEEVTDYSSIYPTWKIMIDDEDVTDSYIINTISSSNTLKIKFYGDNEYLLKKMDIICSIDNVTCSTQLEIISL